MEFPYYPGTRAVVYNEDCLRMMRFFADNSVDAIVTDPPYGLGFMGKAWDDLPPGEEWARECLRVLKPGGHLVAFGGSRTWHRLAVAVEDAGFEIRDSIAWLYGSGFPKSMDVSKAIDAQGARGSEAVALLKTELRRVFDASGMTLAELNERCGFEASGYLRTSSTWASLFPTPGRWTRMREVIGGADQLGDRFRAAERKVVGKAAWDNSANHFVPGEDHKPRVHLDITAPATEAAQQWEGWGTALKPAFEPIVVGRKPLSGTVAANVQEHGTGALNIDACRVNTHSVGPGTTPRSSVNGQRSSMAGAMDRVEYDATKGRWPTNVVLDESQAAELDAQTGITTSGTQTKPTGKSGIWSTQQGQAPAGPQYGDTGGASRFFPVFRYQAKASAKERPRDPEGKGHPTVKPLELMRWLVRLVTPTSGVVLDPFAGSGTTVEAALLEGFHCVAIEREADYLPLIFQRLARSAA